MKIDLVVEKVSESGHNFTRVVAWLGRLPIHERQDDFDDIKMSVLNALTFLESFDILREDVDIWVEKEVISKKRVRYEG